MLDSGADFSLVNENGHSALHKAAQRGSTSGCKWLVDTFLIKHNDVDGFAFIGPDAEGACPSDLCGMNGHDGLSQWISKQECEFVRRTCLTKAIEKTNTKCRKLSFNPRLPPWLQEGVDAAEKATLLRSEDADISGIGRMAATLIEGNTSLLLPTPKIESNATNDDFNDID